MHISRTLAGVAAISAALLMTACTAPTAPPKAVPSTGTAANATSAANMGGMAKLIAAAKKEGQLNVIADPPDWANYGAMIKGFSKKYGIKVNSDQPDASSQDAINAARQLAGTDRAPDFLGLASNVALANLDLLAEYRVVNWNHIPTDRKSPDGVWANEYGGNISIAYDASKVPAPTSINGLLKPAYKGMVALNGDPTQAAGGFAGVVMAALANGGSAENITPGVDFFKKLHDAGNFLPIDPNSATVASGQTPVVIDWDFVQRQQTKELKGKIDWKVVVPAHEAVRSFYQGSVNKGAPHPAAARLWMEYLFSVEGQNTYLRGGATPVLQDWMIRNGTIDKAALNTYPVAIGTPVIPTRAQLAKGQKYLVANWQSAVG